MHLVPLLVCIGLWLLFPKGFKYLVGTGFGAVCGIVAWSLLALVFHGLITAAVFVTFVFWGIVVGCIFAACG